MIKKSKFLKNLLAGSEGKYDASVVGVAAEVTVRYGGGIGRVVTVRAG
jgi:hypothetical protein